MPAGSIVPNLDTEFVAKGSPVFAGTLKDASGFAINLTGATLSGYVVALDQNNLVAKLYGTFAITNASTGQFSYQWTLIDLNVPGTFAVYFTAKLPSDPFQREFGPVTLIILPTPEYIGGFYVQEVDINVNGAPPSSTNPVVVDVTDRSGRVLGTVVITSMPSITGVVSPQVGGVNVSTSNPLPATMGQVGQVAPYGSNPSTTNAGADTQFKFGSGGNTTVQRVWISNETGADVRFELDATSSANSIRLKDGNVLYIQQPCQVVHLFTVSSQNINLAGGVMVRGYN